jgi:hypothetical protein
MRGPPIPMNYQTPGTPPPRRGLSTGLQMLIGLMAGTLVSAIVWIGGWKYVNDGSAASAIVIVPGLKFVVGVTLLCIRGLRGYGGGILVSIALGFLIFFFACAANFRM